MDFGGLGYRRVGASAGWVVGDLGRRRVGHRRAGHRRVGVGEMGVPHITPYSEYFRNLWGKY
jgi:hypothetical protein